MTGGRFDVGRGSNAGTVNLLGGLDTAGDINVVNGSMVVDDTVTIKGIATINDDDFLSVGSHSRAGDP